MRLLVLNQIDGDNARLQALASQSETATIDGVVVLGNLGAAHAETSTEESYRAGLRALEQFGVPVFLIPGPNDPEPATITRLVATLPDPVRFHQVHRAAAACGHNAVIAGFGGRLVDGPTTATNEYPRWEVRVAFEHLQTHDRLFRTTASRVLVFAVPPEAAVVDRDGAEHVGDAAITTIIRQYQPMLVCCGGPAAARGDERISGTRVVNPGWLTDGSYAIVDTLVGDVMLGRLAEPIVLDEPWDTIVVALDGTPESWRALELATGLAARTQARLTLVHAWDRVGLARGQPNLDATLMPRLAAGERLFALARQCLPAIPIDEALLEGPPATAIVRVAATRNAALIVMGTTQPHNRVTLGSVSKQVLHDAPCPVLLTSDPPRNRFLREQPRL